MVQLKKLTSCDQSNPTVSLKVLDDPTFKMGSPPTSHGVRACRMDRTASINT